MAFDLDELGLRVRRHGRVARVMIAETSGSVPREAGTAMLVWTDGQSGTIGGGALEYGAAAAAREALERAEPASLSVRRPLGPGLGQCCGGSVTLVTEVFDARRLEEVRAGIGNGDHHLRHVTADNGNPPDAIRRAVRSKPFGIHHAKGWVSEPVATAKRPLWLYGAGHVGRAVVAVLEPTGRFDIVWVDMSPERFPEGTPESVRLLHSENPADAVRFAPPDGEHVIMTHSHAIDLDICGRLLATQFRSAGLIGSASKWARFRRRLAEAGFGEELIDRIRCPIGMPELGKHPHAIAIGLACSLLGQGVADQMPAEFGR